MQGRHRIVLMGILCLFGVCLIAQNKPAGKKNRKQTKTTKIFLIHADELSADKMLNPDIQRLTGSVAFRHDNTYMYCDSAYFMKNNSLEAFDHVKMVQGDTLFLMVIIYFMTEFSVGYGSKKC